MKRRIKYIAQAVKWRDRINGNTYHSVRVIRCSDGKTIAAPFQYGYGDQYRFTALTIMAEKKWIPVKYRENLMQYRYERENNYPILWSGTYGTKKECVDNGEI